MAAAVPHEAERIHPREGLHANQYNHNQNQWFRKHPLLATAVWLLDWRSPTGELSGSNRSFSETSSTGSMATPNSGHLYAADTHLSNPDFNYSSNVAPSLDFRPDGNVQLKHTKPELGLLGTHHRQTFTLTPKALMPRSFSADSDDMNPNRGSAGSRGDANAGGSHGSRANSVGGAADGSTPGSTNWGWYVSTTPPSAQPYPSMAQQHHVQVQEHALAEDKARADAIRAGKVSPPPGPGAASHPTLAELNRAAVSVPLAHDKPPSPMERPKGV